MCLINTLSKYNVGGYASGNDIVIHLRPYVLIAYICGFISDRQMIEDTKYKWIYRNHQNVLQWDKKRPKDSLL